MVDILHLVLFLHSWVFPPICNGWHILSLGVNPCVSLWYLFYNLHVVFRALEYIEASLIWRKQWNKLLGSLYQGFWSESQRSIPTLVITIWDLCPLFLYSGLGETISVFLCLTQWRHGYTQKLKWLAIVLYPRDPQNTHQTLAFFRTSFFVNASIMGAGCRVIPHSNLVVSLVRLNTSLWAIVSSAVVGLWIY